MKSGYLAPSITTLPRNLITVSFPLTSRLDLLPDAGFGVVLQSVSVALLSFEL